MRARDDARARSPRARARRAPRRSRARRDRSPSGWKNGTTSSRIDASSEASRYCAEREQRPEDDVAVRVGRPDAALALEEHEPLRPVAVGVLVGEDAQQQVAQRLPAAERQQQLDRTLADVARAPAAARSTARGRAARGSGSARCGRTRAGCPADRRRRSRTDCAAGALNATGPAIAVQNRVAAASSSARCRRGRGRGDQAAGDAEADARRRRGDHRQERLPTRPPVGEQHLVAAHRSMVVPACGSMRKHAVGEAAADVGVGDRPHDDPRRRRA